MAGLHQVLSDPEYRNWVKDGVALKCTKKGIERFVDNEMKTFQQNALYDACTVTGLSPGSTCNMCTLHNIIPCPTRGMCSLKNGVCNYHDKRNPSKKYRPCPSGICDKIRDTVVKNHRFCSKNINASGSITSYSGPSWQNTDAQKWCTDHWELSKCFMPASGYTSKLSAAETDFTGIVSVIINNEHFQSVVDENLSQTNNIFCQARNVRNEIMHTSTFRTPDAEMNSHIDIMVKLLSDKTQLLADKNAQDAVTRIGQIKNGSLAVTTEDEAKLRDESLKAIKEIREDTLNTVKDQTMEATTTINKITMKGLESVEEKSKECIEYISKKSNTQLDLVEKTAKAGIETIDKAIEDGSKNIKLITMEATAGATEAISKKKEEDIKVMEEKKDEILKICENTKTTKYHTYIDRKKAFQKELIHIYNEYLFTAISELAPDEEEEVEEIYATPSLERDVQKNINTKNENQFKPRFEKISSYKEVFYKDSKRSKNIYITGDNGIGKTKLCKEMISTWCKAHSSCSQLNSSYHEECDSSSDDSYNEDGSLTNENKSHKHMEHQNQNIESMKKFNFLFFISLRDARSDYDIKDMIKNQLLKSQDHCDLLSTLLEKESKTCLIILDGLDEWVPPENSIKSVTVNPGLPARRTLYKSTVVTTSRPWKLEVLRLKTSEMDHHVKLSGLDSSSSYLFIKQIIAAMNKYGTKKNVKDFVKILKDKELTQFTTNPLILKLLICQWHDGDSIGESQCSIYSGMIEFLFKRAEKQNIYNETDVESNDLQGHLPKCFYKRTKCKEFRHILQFLSRLAFETLFNKDQESPLVFESSIAEMHGLSETQVEICLKIGILSQSKFVKFTNKMKSISFRHKAFHEFLAALYVSVNFGTSDTCKDTILTKCASVDKVLEMANVFIFVSGMSPETANRLSQHIKGIISSETITQENRTHFSYFMDTILLRIQTFIIDCTKEGYKNGYKNIDLKLEDVEISNSDSPELGILLCRNISSVNSLYCSYLHIPIELFAQCNSLLKLHLNYCSLGNETSSNDMLFFSPPLMLTDNCTGKSINACFNENDERDQRVSLKQQLQSNEEILSHFFTEEIMQVNTTQHHEQCSNIYKPATKIFGESIKGPFTDFKVMKFYKTRMSHTIMECLMAFLSRASNLKSINLVQLTCTECHRDCTCQLDLSSHQQLQKLTLDSISVRSIKVNTSLQSCKITSDFLPVHTTFIDCQQGEIPLEDFYLKNCEIKHSEIECLMKFLSRASNLRSIYLENLTYTGCGNDCTCQLDLSSHQQLQELKLDSISIESIKVNTSLRSCETIHLYQPVHTTFIESSQGVTTLEVFRLSDSKMIHSQVKRMMAFLARASNLKYLRLGNLTCSDCGKDCMCQLDLSSCQKLQELELDSISIESIKVSTSLQSCAIYTLYQPLHETSIYSLQSATSMRTLKLSNCSTKHSQIECLMKFLSRVSNLCSIYLENLTCTDCGNDCTSRLY